MLFLFGGSAVANAGEPCPNEALRTGYSKALPACRAYELATSPGVQPYFTTFGNIQNIQDIATAVVGAELGTTAAQSSADSAIAFFSPVPQAGSETGGPDYLSSRGPAGWSMQNLIPPQSTETNPGCLPYMAAWSSDMARGVLADGFNAVPSERVCGADEPELVLGEPRGNVENLFLRDTATKSYELIDQPPVSGEASNAIYQASSSDLGIVAFLENAKLTPEAPAGNDYYVWAGGSVDRLLTILPEGEAAQGAIADAASNTNITTSPTFSHAVAPDGSRIEFTSGGNLYSRVNPGRAQSSFDEAGECDEPSKACTVQIDESETEPGGGGGVFAGGSGHDGGVVYFTDANRLTSDSTASAGEPDLYAYDFSKPVGERLTDLTVDQNAGEHADVLGLVGTNETGAGGEYAYYVAKGVLASNSNSSGAQATAGAPNLYMAHAGATSFVATLSLSDDHCDWENECMMARVSANGRYVGLNSLEQLTGYNNLDATTSKPDQDIFLYDGQEESLSCASCGSTGAAPIAPASIRLPENEPTVNIPLALYLQRNVSDNGQVFFDTPNPLVAGARNGSSVYEQSNVYEYRGGQLSLLSSGTAESSSFFYDASADGNDVYLITFQGLVPGAGSTELSIYDAKVDGGFSPPLAVPGSCSGETCSGPQAPPIQAPGNGSEAFSGPGNLSAASIATKASVKFTKASLADGGRKLIVKASVPAAGRLVVALRGGRAARRAVQGPGTYVLRLSITRRERTALRHHRRLRLSLTFNAADGTTAHLTRTINA